MIKRTNRAALVLALVLILMLAVLAGCGGNKDAGGGVEGSPTEGAVTAGSGADVDVNALANALKDGISFNYDLVEMSDETFFAMYGIEESGGGDIANYAVYASPWSEEVAVFEAVSQDKAAALEKMARSRIDSQKKEFEDYAGFESEVADAVKQLDAAVLTVKGKCVVLVVSGDSAKAEEIIGEYLK